MSEANKVRSRRVFEEVVNQGQLDVVGELFAPDFINQPFGVAGPSGVKQLITMLGNAFPDLQATVEEVIAEGDKVVVRATLRGTHEGPIAIFGNLPATGKPVAISDIVVHRHSNGKIAEGYSLLDIFGLLRQIGAIQF